MTAAEAERLAEYQERHEVSYDEDAWTGPFPRRIQQVEKVVSQGGRVAWRSWSYMFFGAVFMVAGLACFVVAIASTGSYAERLVAAGPIALLMVLFGWGTGWHARLVIDPAGLTVYNPINRASIPWPALREATGAGVSLLLRTDHWSIGVYTVQRANIAPPGSSKADAMAAWLLQFSHHITADTSSSDFGSNPTKRWGWDTSPTLLALAATQLATAALLCRIRS